MRNWRAVFGRFSGRRVDVGAGEVVRGCGGRIAVGGTRFGGMEGAARWGGEVREV